MPSKYSADDIMEKACDAYCKYPVLLKDDEELLEETCRECKLEAMVRAPVRN